MGEIALAVPSGRSAVEERSGFPKRTEISTGQASSLAGIAHDTRNLVTALKLCSDLLAEQGVLTDGHGHFADEIRSVAAASEHLAHRLAAVSRTATLETTGAVGESLVSDLAKEVQQMHGLLSAVAGPTISVEVATLPCRGKLWLSEESLTRILLNLVRNAADAMPLGGRVRITTQRGDGASFFWTLPKTDGEGLQFAEEVWSEDSAAMNSTVVLCIEDNGPGIPPELLPRIFDVGFSTRRGGHHWPEGSHRGLGLSIVQQLVQEAGGTVRARSGESRGARFEIELPLTKVTENLLPEPVSRARQGAS